MTDKQATTYRDIFAEITAKAQPLCEDTSDPEKITAYRVPVGPIHRAAGRVGFQMFDDFPANNPRIIVPVGAPSSGGEVVAWRVRGYADDWLLCYSLSQAEAYATNGNLIQPLYARATEPGK